jgi:hypothetical protein
VRTRNCFHYDAQTEETCDKTWGYRTSKLYERYICSTRSNGSVSTKEICWKTRRCACDRHTSRRLLVALKRVAARSHAVRTFHFQFNPMSNYSLPYYNTQLLGNYLAVRLCPSTFPKHAVEHRFKPHTTCYNHAPGVALRVVPISDVLPLSHEMVGRTHARRRSEMTCRCSRGAREDHFYGNAATHNQEGAYVWISTDVALI